MGQPAAKMGDSVSATDIHIVLVPSPGGPVPTPTPLPFSGIISSGCAPAVLIDGQPAAVLGSGAVNQPPHLPPGGTFQVPPTNQATIASGSATVLIAGAPAARNGDTALTCNDPAPLPNGTVVAVSTVLIGLSGHGFLPRTPRYLCRVPEKDKPSVHALPPEFWH